MFLKVDQGISRTALTPARASCELQQPLQPRSPRHKTVTRASLGKEGLRVSPLAFCARKTAAQDRGDLFGKAGWVI